MCSTTCVVCTATCVVCTATCVMRTATCVACTGTCVVWTTTCVMCNATCVVSTCCAYALVRQLITCWTATVTFFFRFVLVDDVVTVTCPAEVTWHDVVGGRRRCLLSECSKYFCKVRTTVFECEDETERTEFPGAFAHRLCVAADLTTVVSLTDCDVFAWKPSTVNSNFT